MDRPAILAEGVTKSFGDVRALDGIDLAAPPATVLSLLGPNGAGKTTTVRILTTLIEPDAGRAEVLGLDVVKDSTRLRYHIGLAGQAAAVDPILTGAENIEMVGRLYHLDRATIRKRTDEVLERFDLAFAAHRTVRTYSGGMRRRLDLAASLVGRPEVLFLDEPTTGLDPRSRMDLWELIRELVNDGTTLLLTTQYMEEADRLADHIAVVDGGKVIAEGTADELKSHVGGEVIEIHLADRTQVGTASQELDGMGRGSPQADGVAGEITLPVADGAGTLIDVVRRLDAAHVRVADIALRRPTLDDVFLALTGHSAEEDGGADGAAGNGARRGRGSRGSGRVRGDSGRTQA
jgi:ABC-2 type transport system ATP-binding protein